MTRTILMKDCRAQFHPTLSNGKLGGKDVHMMGVSYMPGPEQLTFKNGEIVTDCKGTCTNCADCVKACYAVNSCKRFPNVTRNRVENTMQLRENITKHFADIAKAIKENGVAAWKEFKEHSNVKCFAVNSDLDVSCYCPAYRKDKNGKVVRDSEMTCARCKLCFDSTAKVIGCYEH